LRKPTCTGRRIKKCSLAVIGKVSAPASRIQDTNWLNMMYPRLYLARNLLREDGVIFISIDDHEVENLRRMCDEIFGEENRIACLVWEKSRKNDAKLFSVGHEYMLVYAKNNSVLKEKNIIWREEKPGAKEIWDQYVLLRKQYGDSDAAIETDLQSWFSQLPRTHPSKKWSRYKRIDKHGPWRDRDISWPGGDGPKYEVIHPVTKLPCAIPERGWIYSHPDEMQRQIKKGLVEFRKDHTKPPFRKAHLKPIAEELVIADFDEYEDEDGNDNEQLATQVRGSYIYKQSQVAVKYLRNLMGVKLFNNPKDHVEIKRLIQYACGSEGTVLDFFSGSGTTGESVAELALKEELNIKYILVQLPEPNSEKEKTGKEALKAGYSTIADISKSRLCKIYSKFDIDSVNKGHQAKRGFKVLKLDKSNFKLWQAPSKDISDEELLHQMELNVDHIDPNASQEDLLYELLLKAGVMPTEKVEQIELANHTLFSVADDTLLIHLDDVIDQALIDAVLATAPSQFICLDKAFHRNDQLKTNAVKTFAAFNQGKEKIDQIDFKTV
ncbi:site-specific DNA-methyltransferase, partial [Halomonas sp. NPDC076908]|uniref:site-specific DNA-methyltransferase n=1 Tax=Halomonas sp. NPDC076908 TaxID=3390567 RepID=UPI003CFC0CE4